LIEIREDDMVEKSLEKRTCLRFRIPGASVKYKKEKISLKKNDYIAEFLPVLDISRGGICFLAQELLKFGSLITLQISAPGETVPLTLKGTVRWHSPSPGHSYRYQIGVQFLPYGEKKGQNYPGALVKLIALEQKFMAETAPPEEEPETR
jgi:Tfp pilus assembly protein PilZ